MPIRPSTVPMMPRVGEKPPKFMKTASALALCLLRVADFGLENFADDSVSRPSMTSWMPLRMNSSSSAAASFSRASKPSRRAFSANETRVEMMSRS